MAQAFPDRIGCPDFHRHLATVDRRGFLKAGMLGATGLALGDLLRVEAMASKTGPAPKRVNSVIILWMRGGPSQHDTWDPKPEAPAEYRGEFSAISTNVPGIQLCELLPMSAAVMDKWSIIRSLSHNDAGHGTGDMLCFTGYLAGNSLGINTMPSCGSIVSKQLGALNPKLPAYVVIPKQTPGTDTAYLGPAFAPFETLADPAEGGPFSVPNLSRPASISVDRMGGRRELLGSLDDLRRRIDKSGVMEAKDQFDQQAWQIITGEEARNAFDFDAEPDSVKRRYGLMPSFDPHDTTRCGAPNWAQRMLLARRLIEAGVRLVTVDCRWWDTHVKGFDSLRRGFLPRWDRAFTALVEDLDQRGLMDTTMVIAWGEFGRTPKVNAQGGRDHYPGVFSAVMLGGGIKGGRVIGSSDDKGAFPRDNPKTPQDVLATLYRHLGVDTAVNYNDHTGRPHPVLPSGSPIMELF
jgi:uncharacterized protein (DUF1501 family)